MMTEIAGKCYRRDLLLHARYVLDEHSETVIVAERATFEEDLDGDVSPVDFSLRVTIHGARYSSHDDSREAALYKLEKQLPTGSYFQICHQCRFGIYHPFQGAEMTCVKFAPTVADEVNARGKRAIGDMSVIGKLPISEFDTCDDFQRPLSRSGQPGSPERI